jgi:hypothetical protein
VLSERGEARLRRPVVYQNVDGERRKVPAAYVRRGAREVGFALGAYDRSRPLVIDPALIYSTYLGGSAKETAGAIAADSLGYAYVTGTTFSTDFPVSNPAIASELYGGARSDVFVTKLALSGVGLVYSTYLGGSGLDAGSAIAVDGAGRAYVAGSTSSVDFPTTAGAFSRIYKGDPKDAFVAELDATGSQLIYSTYLGGSGLDAAASIAVDASGAAYVAGSTSSADFPTTPSALQTTAGSNSANVDAFVAKLDPSGSALVYSTYLGGSGVDTAASIALESSGEAYVAGSTLSPDFPTTPGAFSRVFHGAPTIGDAFVAKLDARGSTLVYSTYLGGNGPDLASGIAVDSAGQAYVVGSTGSADFPTTPGAFSRAFNRDPASGDVFVSKLDARGSALLYSTYLGGSRSDWASGIAVDSSGQAYVAGTTGSADFPTTASTALHPTLAGGSDAFVAQLDSAGGSVLYATYLGGRGSDSAAGIAYGGPSDLFVTGTTSSADFPVTSPAVRTVLGGSADVFVVRIGLREGPAIVPTQFIAKLFTEAYGRVPTPDEWAAEYRYFDQPGACSPAALKARGRAFYLSAEFASLGYDSAEKVLALHRGAVNQNPSQADLDNQRSSLDAGSLGWTELVDAVFDSAAFAGLVPAMCKDSGQDPGNYFYGTVPAPTLPLHAGDAGFPGGDGSALQAALDGAPPGGTVFLAQGSVTTLSRTLVVPAGKTLATTGLPPVEQYAKLGRLVMAEPAFSQGSAMIAVQGGAALRSVFVDGNLGSPSRMTLHGPFEVLLFGGAGTALSDSKLAASRSNNTVGVIAEGCSDAEVTGNLLTGYGGQHYPSPDGTHYEQLGVEAGCGNTQVDQNSLVDLTDNSLAAYSVFGGTQASKITNNWVLQAGSSAYAGISLDAIVGDTQARIHSWNGFLAFANHLAGNARVHTDALIAMGTGDFYESRSFPALGSGAAILENEAVSEPTLVNRVNVALSTQAMLSAVQTDTYGETLVAPTGIRCASGERMAAVSASRASGTLELPYRDVLLNNCMWH